MYLCCAVYVVFSSTIFVICCIRCVPVEPPYPPAVGDLGPSQEPEPVKEAPPYPQPPVARDPARELFRKFQHERVRRLRIESFICRDVERVTVCLSTMYDCCLLRPVDYSETLIVVHIRRIPAEEAVPIVEGSTMEQICSGKTWFVTME